MHSTSSSPLALGIEADLANQIAEEAEELGWHTRREVPAGGGRADLVLTRGPCTVVIEAKTAIGGPTSLFAADAQTARYVQALNACRGIIVTRRLGKIARRQIIVAPHTVINQVLIVPKSDVCPPLPTSAGRRDVTRPTTSAHLCPPPLRGWAADVDGRRQTQDG